MNPRSIGVVFLTEYHAVSIRLMTVGQNQIKAVAETASLGFLFYQAFKQTSIFKKVNTVALLKSDLTIAFFTVM